MSTYIWDLFPTELVTKVKPINSVEVHPMVIQWMVRWWVLVHCTVVEKPHHAPTGTKDLGPSSPPSTNSPSSHRFVSSAPSDVNNTPNWTKLDHRIVKRTAMGACWKWKWSRKRREKACVFSRKNKAAAFNTRATSSCKLKGHPSVRSQLETGDS
jgi:hypothetical protein